MHLRALFTELDGWVLFVNLNDQHRIALTIACVLRVDGLATEAIEVWQTVDLRLFLFQDLGQRAALIKRQAIDVLDYVGRLEANEIWQRVFVCRRANDLVQRAQVLNADALVLEVRLDSLNVRLRDCCVGQVAVVVHRVHDDVVALTNDLHDLGQSGATAHSPDHIALHVCRQRHKVWTAHHLDGELELAAIDTGVAHARVSQVSLDTEHALAQQVLELNRWQLHQVTRARREHDAIDDGLIFCDGSSDGRNLLGLSRRGLVVDRISVGRGQQVARLLHVFDVLGDEVIAVLFACAGDDLIELG